MKTTGFANDPGANIDRLLAEAIAHHDHKRLAEAEAGYRQVLQLQPGHAEAMHRLGVLAYEVGQVDVAADLIGRAVRLAPRNATYRANLANVLNDLARPGQAIDAAQSAIQIEPNLASAHLAIGVALQKLGQFEQSIQALQNAIRVDPNLAPAFTNLGSALAGLRRIDEAIERHRQAIKLSPGLAVAHYNVGVLLKQIGDIHGAIASLEQAVAFHPRLVDARIHLGISYVMLGRLHDAVEQFTAAINLDPARPEAYNNLANLLIRADEPEQAGLLFRKLLEMDPHNAIAMGNFGNALKDQGLFDDALAAHRTAISLDPANAEVHSSLLILMHFDPSAGPAEILSQSRVWAGRFAEHLPRLRPHVSSSPARRKLKVGYVSADLREHYIGRVIRSLIEHHDHSTFDIHCYSNSFREDDLTRKIQASPVVWRNIASMDDQAAAEVIARDELDLLIDLSCHMAGAKPLIFARKPAPAQATWLAYPGTTGMSAVDYRITDPLIDPPGEFDAFYSEKSVYLPDCYWLFDARGDAADVSHLPASTNGYLTFGSFNTFCKLNAQVIELWASTVHAAKNSRLILIAPPGQARARTIAMFAERGISAERIEFVRRASREKYLQFFHRVDVMLDSFPWNGHTTTLDAVWMGVPTLTLPGRSAIGRGGVSILTNVGLTQFITSSQREFVDIGEQLSQDLPRLAELRQQLRQRMRESRLMDAQTFARSMEAAFRTMIQS